LTPLKVDQGLQIKDLTPLMWAALAATAPSLLAWNPPPSPTFLNQALALAGWGGFVVATGAAGGGGRRAAAAAWPLLGALALLALGVAVSWGPGTLPAPLALSALGLLAAAAVMVAGGAAARAAPTAGDLLAAFCWGWLIAGAVNVGLAAVQVFAPDWADGTWLARSGLPGRAVGNLRQPNHLSSLLLWAAIATVTLLQMRRLPPWPARAVFALLLAAVVMTASRTGLVSVVLLAAWGALDRALARDVRRLLLAAPVLYALAWAGLWLWAQAGEHAFGAAARLQETDISGSRFGIWANTLALIARQPWTGVGFGEFNLAWSLTPFPGRPTAFFDHAHNLPLHLAAELGLPLAGAVLALLAWALWRGWRSTGRTGAPADAATDAGDAAAGARGAWMVVMMIGVHSLLEYPLWYAHFLLPAAWAWGFALARPASSAARAPRPGGLPWAGTALVAGAALAVADYARVVRIFEAGPGAAPLAQRVAEGRRSWLFAHHADYAAATTGLPQPDGDAVFDGAKHYLLDTRLMTAWARALAARGDVDAAAHVAARLREFGAARAPALFAGCDAPADADPTASAPAWACDPPPRVLDWRDLARPAQARQAGGATQ
jgi:O-antigen ligase